MAVVIPSKKSYISGKMNLDVLDFIPYGGTAVVNVLENFIGTPDIQPLM